MNRRFRKAGRLQSNQTGNDPRCTGILLTVALFKFLTTAARARFITADLGQRLDRSRFGHGQLNVAARTTWRRRCTTGLTGGDRRRESTTRRRSVLRTLSFRTTTEHGEHVLERLDV